MEATRLAEHADDEEVAPPAPTPLPAAPVPGEARAPRPSLLIGLAIGAVALLGLLLLGAGLVIALAARRR